MYTDDRDLVTAVEEYVRLSDAIAVEVRDRERIRNMLIRTMDRAGDNYIETDSYFVSRTVRTRIEIDRKALEAEYPDAYAEVTRIAPSAVLKGGLRC